MEILRLNREIRSLAMKKSNAKKQWIAHFTACTEDSCERCIGLYLQFHKLEIEYNQKKLEAEKAREFIK